jgi:hypothetical protein
MLVEIHRTVDGFRKDNWPSLSKLRQILEAAPPDQWAGFQAYYAMSESEVSSSTGVDLVDSMLAVFSEVTPAMNLSMQIELREHGPGRRVAVQLN